MINQNVYTNESKLRSLLKSFSWRIIAIADTIVIVLLVTCLAGDCGIKNALAIGLIEFVFKFILYYFHERIWLAIQFKNRFGVTRTLYKTMSWRVLATFTTFMIADEILNTNNNTALYIAGIEVFTKTLLYYMHERLWLILPLGKLRTFAKNIIYAKKHR